MPPNSDFDRRRNPNFRGMFERPRLRTSARHLPTVRLLSYRSRPNQTTPRSARRTVISPCWLEMSILGPSSSGRIQEAPAGVGGRDDGGRLGCGSRGVDVGGVAEVERGLRDLGQRQPGLGLRWGGSSTMRWAPMGGFARGALGSGTILLACQHFSAGRNRYTFWRRRRLGDFLQGRICIRAPRDGADKCSGVKVSSRTWASVDVWPESAWFVRYRLILGQFRSALGVFGRFWRKRDGIAAKLANFGANSTNSGRDGPIPGGFRATLAHAGSSSAEVQTRIFSRETCACPGPVGCF